jgi:hypothetical protein
MVARRQSGNSEYTQYTQRDAPVKEKTKEPVQEGLTAPYRVRLPGFLLGEETGLGDLIKKATYAIGVPHCKGCERREAALNRWIRFTH